ncbi:hypothetical protein FFLO_05970 [Filobasidium floriforme]|uniref:Major facilitator superfamily (MFS) profile domain-containing protein n=1 Tax=Filobasidium floriforme TaxID=5210 RepID=A0A8K0JG15_9TREE|nr:hypothetical protein FFLO_05970 [Filobasidium floriforme]
MTQPLRPTTSIDDHEKEKHAAEHAEYASSVNGAGHELAIVLPDSLIGMTEEETEAMDKRITRRIDWIIMPVSTCLHVLNYLDRQNIASAKLAGIMDDLSLSTTDYNSVVSILFVGYIGFQVPSNMIIGKISRPALYICLACAAWGVVSALTAAVHNYVGLMMGRVALGITEAVFFPGAIFYLSCWYTKKQFALRTAILYSGSQLGNAFGPLLAIAILELDGAHGLAGWRWLFLVEGVFTVGIAIICIFILPDVPQKARLLTSQEKDRLVYRLQMDRGQVDNSSEISAWKGFMMAVTDPKTWLLCGILTSTYIAAAVNNFFPSVVSTLGYSRNITYCLTAPPFVLCVFVIILNGMHSDKTQERYLHIACPLVITVVANILAVATTKTAPRYVAMMLMPASFYASAICTLSWISGSTVGPAIKRAVVLSMINAISNTPNVWTAYLYKSPPRYLVAFSVNLAAAVIAIGFASMTYLYLRKQNRKLEAGEPMGNSGPTETQISNGFRYPL